MCTMCVNSYIQNVCVRTRMCVCVCVFLIYPSAHKQDALWGGLNDSLIHPYPWQEGECVCCNVTNHCEVHPTLLCPYMSVP